MSAPAIEKASAGCMEKEDIVRHVTSSFQQLYFFPDWAEPGTTT